MNLALPAVVFVLLAIGLIWSITNLVRGNSRDILAYAPVVPQQEISLPSTGEVLIVMEVPRIGSDFRNFQIELIAKNSAPPVIMKYSYATAQGAVYGISTMQVPFGRMTAQAGIYVVRIAGMQPGTDYSSHRLIVSRPYMARMVRQILAIVFCAVGMLLSLLWALWQAGLLKPAAP